MKILVITARYPPYHSGGYEIRCKNIVDGLAARGHQIVVLSSRKDLIKKCERDQYPILRRLHDKPKPGNLISRLTLQKKTYILGILLSFVRSIIFDLLDTSLFDRQIKHFKPDVIYLGHITNLTKALMPYLSGKKIPIYFDEGGSGLTTSWTEKGVWFKFIEKNIGTGPIIKQLKGWFITTIWLISAGRIKRIWCWPEKMQIVFNSELNKMNAVTLGVPVENARVIHSGIDTGLFSFQPRVVFNNPLLIIVPGRIEKRKGQLDAVKLLDLLLENKIDSRLVFVGQNGLDLYIAEVQVEIIRRHLENYVQVFPMVSQEELVMHYQIADICFFPSYYRSGFSRVPLEAMACGCVVITYGNEGSDEIIINNINGYSVQGGDFIQIIQIIKNLIMHPSLVQNISLSARNNIQENYSMHSYIDHIENFLVQ